MAFPEHDGHFALRDDGRILASERGVATREIVEHGTELWQFSARLAIVYVWWTDPQHGVFQVASEGYANQRDQLRQQAQALGSLKVGQQPDEENSNDKIHIGNWLESQDGEPSVEFIERVRNMTPDELADEVDASADALEASANTMYELARHAPSDEQRRLLTDANEGLVLVEYSRQLAANIRAGRVGVE